MPLDRSEQMARIRGRDTGPELLLRRFLWSAGIRYRLATTVGSARPDIVFRRKRVAVFVDGCQWHGCPEHYVRPRSNTAFWLAKLATNVSRDRRQTIELERSGWRVVRIWEHDVFGRPDVAVDWVRNALERRAWKPDASLRVVHVEVVDPIADVERRRMEELRGQACCEEVRKRTTGKWVRRYDLKRSSP